MANKTLWKMRPVPLEDATVDGGLLGRRMALNRTVTIPAVHEQLRKTGRIDALKLAWKPGMPRKPHLFWDSDVAKWLEAAAYALAAGPNRGLRMRINRVVDLIAAAQQPDGYVNSYFSAVALDQRWTNLRDQHELYCAGHLMEAAVAHHEVTGDRKLLDAMCRCADHIGLMFGRGRGKRRGYPGHEEIELALVRLHRATGEPRYLALARYFIGERGRRPHYFDREARARGEDPADYWAGSYDYCQAHLPVRQQETAEGHAVRAMYLYSGMADVAAETGDRELLAACKRLWRNVVERRMYVTGGVGSAHEGERFTSDYDLPNQTAYAETCAAIGLVLWAHRMLHFTGEARYADVMERALYNGVLSGVSLDGRRFFYVNPLAVAPEPLRSRRQATTAERQEWFSCACCPPNLARLVASLPRYVYSQAGSRLYVHLFAEGSARFQVGGSQVTLSQRTAYPWNGRVRLKVRTERPRTFTLAVRMPGWCRGARLAVNGEALELGALVKGGYARIRRSWKDGDRAELDLPMPVERVRAHPRVRADAGRAALQRGPLVYCLEEADNGPLLDNIALWPDAHLHAQHHKDLLGGVTVIAGRARRTVPDGWPGGLYGTQCSRAKSVPIKAVPYCAWANRGRGEMLVWIREC